MAEHYLYKVGICLALAAACVFAVLLWISRRHTRRIMQSLSNMLKEALDGTFREDCYDESMLSLIESRMVQYLAASEKMKREREKEQDRIQGLVSDISHQTKTPLSNIVLYSQLLSEQSLPPECRHYARAVQMQAEKLDFLIRSLVKISRLENGTWKLKPVKGKISDLVEEVCQQAEKGAARKGISLYAEKKEAAACFDAKWTSEALYNILDNAIKYTPEGGRIDITVLEYEMFTVVQISDTGIGIGEEEQAQIFERFYRSARVQSEEGVGLGLYLARQIIAGQGGYIKVRSEPGEGSEFSVYLPR